MDNPSESFVVTSLQNPRVKGGVKLRKRSVRDETGQFLIEGYRENRRALDRRIRMISLFYCPALFQGRNEPSLLADARDAGVELVECSEAVFRKMAYRDRPEGLLAVARQDRWTLDRLALSA